MSDIMRLLEDRLSSLVPALSGELAEVPGMLSYSLDGGGKRVRPVLCMEFCEACGGRAEDALSLACAVEFIHTYSLIHDDLPCMDNDDFRRGKPSSHVRFGEANALLAGDALLTRAFGIIADGCAMGEISADTAVRAVAELSERAGAAGMIGGQYIDLKYENADATADVLFEMDALKTSALIQAACVLGAMAAGADERAVACAREFGLSLGIAFQIKDDLIEYDAGETSDEDNGKQTYITLLGRDGAEAKAAEYTRRATAALEPLGEAADGIRRIAGELLYRTK